MKPFQAALWVAKFVASLALLFSIPVVIVFGGVYAVHAYEVRQAVKQAAAEHAKFCAEMNARIEHATKHNAGVPDKTGAPAGSIEKPILPYGDEDGKPLDSKFVVCQ